MGLPVRIRLYSSSETAAGTAGAAAFARIAALDQMMSDYRPDSDNGVPISSHKAHTNR